MNNNKLNKKLDSLLSNRNITLSVTNNQLLYAAQKLNKDIPFVIYQLQNEKHETLDANLLSEDELLLAKFNVLQVYYCIDRIMKNRIEESKIVKSEINKLIESL